MTLFPVHPIVHRTRIGKAVRDLKLMEATPAEIEFRIAVHLAKWPMCEPTIESVVKHWMGLGQMPKAKGADKVRSDADAAAAQTEAWILREQEHRAAVLAQRKARQA